MIARVTMILMLLWAGPAIAQETDADAQSPFACPQAAEFVEAEDCLFAFSGDEPKPPAGQQGRRGGEMRAGERFGRLEQLRMRKLQEFLELSDVQRDKLVPLLRESRREQRQLDIDRRRAVEELAEEVKSNHPDDRELAALMTQIRSIEMQRSELKESFLTKAEDILGPVQMAKLVIFEARFEMELLERMRDRRDHPPMPRGPRNAPPPDREFDGE